MCLGERTRGGRQEAGVQARPNATVPDASTPTLSLHERGVLCAYVRAFTRLAQTPPAPLPVSLAGSKCCASELLTRCEQAHTAVMTHRRGGAPCVCRERRSLSDGPRSNHGEDMTLGIHLACQVCAEEWLVAASAHRARPMIVDCPCCGSIYLIPPDPGAGTCPPRPHGVLASASRRAPAALRQTDSPVHTV